MISENFNNFWKVFGWFEKEEKKGIVCEKRSVINEYRISNRRTGKQTTSHLRQLVGWRQPDLTWSLYEIKGYVSSVDAPALGYFRGGRVSDYRDCLKIDLVENNLSEEKLDEFFESFRRAPESCRCPIFDQLEVRINYPYRGTMAIRQHESGKRFCKSFSGSFSDAAP